MALAYSLRQPCTSMWEGTEANTAFPMGSPANFSTTASFSGNTSISHTLRPCPSLYRSSRFRLCFNGFTPVLPPLVRGGAGRWHGQRREYPHCFLWKSHSRGRLPFGFAEYLPDTAWEAELPNRLPCSRRAYTTRLAG